MLFPIILSTGLALGQQFPRIQQLFSQGRLEEVRTALGAELTKFPSHPELLYWKAILELQSGHADQAERTLRPLVESGIARPPHFTVLGDVYSSNQQWEKAASTYRKALGGRRDPGLVYKLGLAEFRARDFEGAVKTIASIIDQTSPPPLHHVLGLAYFGLGRNAEALPHLAAAAKGLAREAGPQYDYALVLMETERFQPAEEHFRLALRLRPDWAAAHLYLGRTLHDQNRSQDALDEFRRAGEIDPKLPLLHHHFGLAYKGRGEFDKAIAEFLKELAEGRQHPPTLFQLAEIAYNRGDLDRSRSFLEPALKASPGSVRFRLLAARLAMKQKKLQESESHLLAAIEADPMSNQAFWQLGRLRLAQGRRDEAKEAFARSRAIADKKGQRR